MLEAWHPLWHLTSFSTGGFSDCLRHGILDRSRASVLPPNFSIRICSDLLLHLHPWLHISKVTSAQSITAIFFVIPSTYNAGVEWPGSGQGVDGGGMVERVGSLVVSLFVGQ